MFVLVIARLVIIFKKEISDLLKRICQFKGWGFELNTVQTAADKENIPQEAANFASNNAPLIEELKEQYENDKEALSNEIVARDIIIEFERIYNQIFGSQIRFLLNLQESIHGLGILSYSLFWQGFCEKNTTFLKDWSVEKY